MSEVYCPQINCMSAYKIVEIPSRGYLYCNSPLWELYGQCFYNNLFTHKERSTVL